MIDYEKLKKAHELALKLPETCQITMRSVYKDGKFFINYYLDVYGGGIDSQGIWMEIDDMIIKLTELTQPKTKDAYYLSENNRCILTTKVIDIKGCFGHHDDTSVEAIGKRMWWSKESLINAQIDYWTKLKGMQLAEIKYE